MPDMYLRCGHVQVEHPAAGRLSPCQSSGDGRKGLLWGGARQALLLCPLAAWMQ